MSTNEELEEHAHHAKEPFDRKVAVTMAIIAAVLATVSVGAHIFANEELLLQQQASDQWAYYQAKSARRYASDVARDTLKAMQSAEVSEKYSKNAETLRKRRRRDSDRSQKAGRRKQAERQTILADGNRRSISGDRNRLRLAGDLEQRRLVSIWHRGDGAALSRIGSCCNRSDQAS